MALFFVNELLICLCTLAIELIHAQSNGDESGDVAEVRKVLNDIKIASIKKYGAFSDSDLTLSRARARIRPPDFDDGTELTANRAIAEDLFENDIVLTLPQANAILNEIVNDKAPLRNRRSIAKRQAAPSISSFWKNTNAIPYVFKYSDTAWQQLILRAQIHIASETCIRFKAADPNSLPTDYIQFIRGSGCWSNVGRIGGAQQVSIGFGCDAMGIAAHEMLHALGLWHEQSRTDRDAYILVNYNYIYPGTQSNFEKRTTRNSDNMDQPYDLGSVMHYGSRAFSTQSDKYSLVTVDSSYQQTIGQRIRISFKDAKMINLRYCTKMCSSDLDCKNGGYTNPNKCTECKCPDGYGGTLCDQVPQSNVASCNGGEYSATNNYNLLRSPYVTARTHCYYRIKAADNQKIEMKFTQINFPCKDACDSYVEVKYKNDKIATGARLCCELPNTLLSEGPEVVLIFNGADDSSLRIGYLGFQLTYRAVSRTPVVSTAIYTSNRPAPSEIKNNGPQPYRCWWRWKNGYWRTSRTAPSTSAPTSATASPTNCTASTCTGEWSDWAAWSVCTVSCGGCGYRKRVRACYGGNRKCAGFPSETEACGLDPCPIESKTMRCKGRLLMPCDLVQKLDFGTVLKENTIFNDSPAKSTPVSNTITTNTAIPTKATKLKNSEYFMRRYRRDDNQIDENFNADEPTFIEFGPEIKNVSFDYDNGNGNDSLPLLHLMDTEMNTKLLKKYIEQQSRQEQVGIADEILPLNSRLKRATRASRHVSVETQLGQSRRRRFVDGSKQSDSKIYCEKLFSYNCPTAFLTISMDWRTAKDTQSRDGRRCCQGYYMSGSKCINNN